jgi:hypothetical protein
MCGLPLGDYNLTNGCHGERMPANFSPPVCSSTAGEAGKNWFFLVICCLPQVFSVYLQLASIVCKPFPDPIV